MIGLLIPVSSSAIRAIGYDSFRMRLAVVFTTSDTVYVHPGVPLSVYLGLMRAPSKGTYYNQHIRGRYR
jgi:hypothetical protein